MQITFEAQLLDIFVYITIINMLASTLFSNIWHYFRIQKIHHSCISKYFVEALEFVRKWHRYRSRVRTAVTMQGSQIILPFWA